MMKLFIILQEASSAMPTKGNWWSNWWSNLKWFNLNLSGFEVIAALASIIGLPLAVLGFYVTWKAASQARDASTQAQDAVAKFRDDLSKIDVIAELHRFCDGTADVKKFMRANLLPTVADRLSELKRLLISCRSSPMFASQQDQTTFQNAIAFLATSENNIESRLAERRDSLDLVRIAKELSSITDAIQTLLIQARTTIGTND